MITRRGSETAINISADGSSHRGRAYREAMRDEEWLEADSDAARPQIAARAAAAAAAEKQNEGSPVPPVALDAAHAKVVVEEGDDRALWDWGTYFSSLPKKLTGGLDKRLPVPPVRELVWSWIGAFLGILAVSAMNQWASPEIDVRFLIGSFGASAVLIYGVIESKLAQPRNFIGGQVISALVGTTTRLVIHKQWIASPVGMSLSLLAMQLTSTTHPPGGATALIICQYDVLPRWSGYSYVITVLVGCLVMQLIALVVNNLDPRRRYPTYWW